MAQKKKTVGRPATTFTKAQMRKAITGSRGIMTVVAKRLGVMWGTAKKIVMANDEYVQWMYEERESMIDNAEVKLGEQVDAGEQWAVNFILKTLGKDRGYTERKEVTGKDAGPLDLTLTFVEPDES